MKRIPRAAAVKVAKAGLTMRECLGLSQGQVSAIAANVQKLHDAELRRDLIAAGVIQPVVQS